MSTWAESGVVKFHLQLTLKSDAKLYAFNAKSFVLRGTGPHRSQCDKVFGKRFCTTPAGLYYVSCPKIGSVRSIASGKAITD